MDFINSKIADLNNIEIAFMDQLRRNHNLKTSPTPNLSPNPNRNNNPNSKHNPKKTGAKTQAHTPTQTTTQTRCRKGVYRGGM